MQVSPLLFHGTTPEGLRSVLLSGIRPPEGDAAYLASSEIQAARYVHHHHAWKQFEGAVVHSFLGEPEAFTLGTDDPPGQSVYVLQVDAARLDSKLLEQWRVNDPYYLKQPIYTYDTTVPADCLIQVVRYPVLVIRKGDFHDPHHP